MQILNIFHTTFKIMHTIFPYYITPCSSYGGELFVRS